MITNKQWHYVSRQPVWRYIIMRATYNSSTLRFMSLYMQCSVLWWFGTGRFSPSFGVTLLALGQLPQYQMTNLEEFGQTLDLMHNSHDAPVPYPTMHQLLTAMCTCVHIVVTKWCIVGYSYNALWGIWDESATLIKYEIKVTNKNIIATDKTKLFLHVFHINLTLNQFISFWVNVVTNGKVVVLSNLAPWEWNNYIMITILTWLTGWE